MKPILSIQNLSFRSVIQYPDLHIATGKVTFLCGESGCGKSTLLKLFNGTLSPDSGHLFYNGTDILDLDTIRLRQEVLLVSQSVFLFDGSIEDNFFAYYSYRNVTPPSTGEMVSLLALCCADFPLDMQCNLMSGGERQRVFLAINLSFSPRILMLDEPTSALDETTAHRLLKQLKDYCPKMNMTLLVISHDSTLSDQYADEIILLTKGESICMEL